MLALGRAACSAVLSTGVSSKATTAAAHTAGRLLVVFVCCQSATAITVTDTAGNTWTSIGITVVAGPNTLRMLYAYNSLGHAANVVTATLASGTANGFLISVVEFGGPAWVNAPTVATGNGTSAGSSSIDGHDRYSGRAAVGLYGGVYGGQWLGGMTSAGLYVGNFPVGGLGGYFADGHVVAAADQACGFTYAGSGGAVIAAAFTPVP